MTEPLVFVVPGTPQGKGRPRFSGKSRTTYTPANTKAYEATVGRMALVNMRGRDQFNGPVHMDLRAHMPIPASWNKARKEAALLGALRPVGRPDIDNIIKVIADGLNGIAFADDAAIVSVSGSKVYAAGEPFVCVTIKSISSHRVPEIPNVDIQR